MTSTGIVNSIDSSTHSLQGIENLTPRRKACEARINDFPQFTAEIDEIQLHFAALFSENPDAVPIVLLHGWPGIVTSLSIRFLV